MGAAQSEPAKVRVKFIPTYIDDFLEDSRVMRLTISDQGKWLLLILKMCRQDALLPDDALLVSCMLGLSKNEGIKFLERLKQLKLLVYSPNENHMLHSPRLTAEYRKAYDKCAVNKINGGKGGKAKAEKAKDP